MPPAGGIAGYLARSETPLAALWLVLPLVILYELGTWYCATQLPGGVERRIVAYTQVRHFFAWFGATALWLPPAGLVAVLAGQALFNRAAPRPTTRTLAAMTLESLAWALPLLGIAQALRAWPLAATGGGGIQTAVHTVFTVAGNANAGINGGGGIVAGGGAGWGILAVGGGGATPAWLTDYLPSLVASVGAGLYEELVFRLVLITLAHLVLVDLARLPKSYANVGIVLVSGLTFSLYHYTGSETFDVQSFVFRSLAGFYFAALFMARGFGVTVGSHAVYDIIVQTLRLLATSRI